MITWRGLRAAAVSPILHTAMSDFALPPELPRAALVTGAARRIGRAIALDLSRAGLAVAIHYRTSQSDAEALAAEIAGAGGKAAALGADLAREAESTMLVSRANAALGPLGVLVNNASLFERDGALSATRASWDAHFETNLRAPFVLSPHDSKTLLFGGNHLFRTTDRGESWKIISPDLSTNDSAKTRIQHGGITRENTGAETHGTITSVSQSPSLADVVWVGTDDGNIQVTRSPHGG